MLATLKRAGRLALVLGLWAVTGFAHWWLAFAIVGAGLGLMYAWSLATNPFAPCWLCGGPGTRSDRTGIWPWAFGLCPVCHGAKQRLRLGVRVLTPARARRLAVEYRTAESSRGLRRSKRLVP